MWDSDAAIAALANKEWEVAYNAMIPLRTAGVKYALIAGNHERAKHFTASPFANDSFMLNEIDGYYSNGDEKLGNYYINFDVGEHKYTLITLEFGAVDEILEWAGSIADANPDRRVIMTTHAYMFRDGTTLDKGDVVPPDSTGNKAANNGDEMWDKFVSQHGNIVLVISGHDPYADIAWRQDIGVHGNTVSQFLIDPQGMSATTTGMVALFHFSADGSQVAVEYVSTHRSNDQYNIYYRNQNQFEFTLIPDEFKGAHSYDNACDTECNDCGETREITHDFSVTDKDESGHWLACSVCGEVDAETKSDHVYNDAFDASCNECGYEREIERKLVIISAFINLDENINIVYRTYVPEGFENAYMVFAFNGEEYRVDEYFIDDEGRYCFAFKDIAPHMMGDSIKATLYANDGAVSVEKASYSIKEYCEYQLANSNDTKVKTLVSDLLVYGAKAQLYMGYNTDALVTDGIAGLTASEFTALDESAYKVALSGEASALAYWSSIGLYLDNDMTVRLTFKAESVEGLTVEIKVGDEITVVNADEFIGDGKGNYRIYFDGVMATEFDTEITASFKLNGEAIGQTLTYSVNSYVYYMQESSDETLCDLVKAIYNYGKSAVAYKG